MKKNILAFIFTLLLITSFFFSPKINLCKLFFALIWSELISDYLIIANSVRVNEGLSDGYFSDGLVTVSFKVYFPYSSSFVT